MSRTTVPLLFTLIVTLTKSIDVELMEFEDELSDPDYICHWSIWTESACQRLSNTGACRADLRRRCVCLKFANIPHNLNSTDYLTRTCSFGTLQEKTDKPNGRCDSNCQLLDGFFRRVEGLHGAWCSWSDWQRSTCKVSSDGLMEGFQTSQRKCLCPPPWLEGDVCHGSDSRSSNCRDSLNDVPSRFLNIWRGLFDSAVIGVILPSALIIWFCCLAGPMRQGLQFGRLQSAAVIAELRVHRARHLAALRKQAEEQRRAAGGSASASQEQARKAGELDPAKRRILRGREATRLRRRRKFIWQA
ncbi:hypothetical protein BOX15_Mlig011016g1 [Macrostomum lignano]|uniref:EGF-like domain-containing protein n=1 Tax=Macrostomum lignano TaxID=282301 RepID=A0A267H4Z2_9PLAT|nr:hypothetical protein BOX15_Mlig011016g1 [Macrostomum lignano]